MRRPSTLPVAAVLLAPSWAAAADFPATPDNYRDVLEQLQPGDEMVLAPGMYPRLTIDGITGTQDAWITIRGPADGDPAVVVGESGHNTVQLYGSSYVAIKNLTIDVQGLYVDAINAKDSISHHILIEDNTLTGFPAGAQQIVGISTKSPAFGWVIRRNTIIEAGTGLYLGNSEGDQPFIDGRIEYNFVLNPVGYCMQIKHQHSYEAPGGLTPGPHTTVIRHNVFIKDDRPSEDGDRPNLLVGGFPDSGPGADDLYDIYGNFLFYNPRESLFQGAGRISMHDNIFVGAGDGTAILLTSHQGSDVKLAHVYNNTIYGVDTGIWLSGGTQSAIAMGNLVFAGEPIGGSFDVVADNIVGTTADAASYVTSPALELDVMDFYPLPGAVAGDPLDLSAFGDDEAFDVDFNGMPKGDFRYRGAYAGEGENPGCALAASIKCTAADDGSGGSDDGGDADDSGDGGGGTGGASSVGSDGGSAGGSDGTPTGGAGADGDETGGSGSSSIGCGCTQRPQPTWQWLLLAALGYGARSRVKSSALRRWRRSGSS